MAATRVNPSDLEHNDFTIDQIKAITNFKATEVDAKGKNHTYTQLTKGPWELRWKFETPSKGQLLKYPNTKKQLIVVRYNTETKKEESLQYGFLETPPVEVDYFNVDPAFMYAQCMKPDSKHKFDEVKFSVTPMTPYKNGFNENRFSAFKKIFESLCEFMDADKIRTLVENLDKHKLIDEKLVKEAESDPEGAIKKFLEYSKDGYHKAFNNWKANKAFSVFQKLNTNDKKKIGEIDQNDPDRIKKIRSIRGYHLAKIFDAYIKTPETPYTKMLDDKEEVKCCMIPMLWPSLDPVLPEQLGLLNGKGMIASHTWQLWHDNRSTAGNAFMYYLHSIHILTNGIPYKSGITYSKPGSSVMDILNNKPLPVTQPLLEQIDEDPELELEPENKTGVSNDSEHVEDFLTTLKHKRESETVTKPVKKKPRKKVNFKSEEYVEC